MNQFSNISKFVSNWERIGIFTAHNITTPSGGSHPMCMEKRKSLMMRRLIKRTYSQDTHSIGSVLAEKYFLVMINSLKIYLVILKRYFPLDIEIFTFLRAPSRRGF